MVKAEDSRNADDSALFEKKMSYYDFVLRFSYAGILPYFITRQAPTHIECIEEVLDSIHALQDAHSSTSPSTIVDPQASAEGDGRS